MDRLAPIAGIAFAVFIFITRLLVWSYPDSTAPTNEVISFWTDKHDKLMVISLLDSLAGLLFLWFAALIRDTLWRAEGGSGRLATLAFAGAILLAGGIWVDAWLVFAATNSVGDVQPEVTQTMSALQADFFFPLLGGFALFFLAAGISAVRTAALPRWAAWSAVAIGVLWLLPNPLAIFLTFIWAIAVGVFLFLHGPQLVTQTA